MRRISVLFLCSLGIFLNLASVNLLGQATDGNIVGRVMDKSGAEIPIAKVEVLNQDTNVRYPVISNNDGSFRVNNVPVGKYTITATATGFAGSSLKNFAVELNKTSTANLTLDVSSVTTTLEVTEASVAINTTNAQLQSSYDSRQALDLSLGSNILGGGNNMGVNNLSLLSAGVASSGGVGYGSGPSVGGQRPTNNNFVVDGIDNNRRDVTGPIAYVSNEATAEFTLLQNYTSPEFGHSSGGIFNTVVKSGTNNVHGSLYDYLQNKNFNALDASFKRQGISERQRLDQNRLGGAIGGPIKKDKLFYFGNFEYVPLGQAGAPALGVYAPTASGFSALDSLANSGAISRTNYDIFKQYVQPAPAANGEPTPVAGVNIPTGILPIIAPSYQNAYYYLGSVDYNLSEKDQIRGRFVGNNLRAINNTPTLPVFFSNQPTDSYLASATWFHNFGPSVLNEAKAAYTRFAQQVPAGNFTYPGLDVFPNITIEQDLNMQIGPDPNAPQGSIINSYQLADNLSWTKGRHTLKFGYDGRRIIAPQSFVQRSRGDYGYNTLNQFLLDRSPDSLGERTFGISDFWGNLTSHYLYANDDFKLTHNLTLNLGIRWEYVGIPSSAASQALNSAASVPGLITFGTPAVQKNNWAPRVGLAWSPGKSGTTVVRAGFGFAYDQNYQNLGILSLPPQFASTFNVDPAANTPNFLANGGLRNPGVGAALTPDEARAFTSTYIPDQLRPYSINWTIGVQKVLANDYTVEVRYLGNRGAHLPMQIQLNNGTSVTPTNSLPTYLSAPSQAQLDALPLTLTALQNQIDPVSQRYINAGFQNFITAFMPTGNSTYHGLAFQVNKRFSSGLQFVSSYTWSHMIDDSTAALFSTFITPRRAQDFQNLRPERASSALDRRHRWTMSWVYETQWLKNSNWFAKNIVGNWSVTGTYTAESAMYATVQSAVDSNLNGDTAGDRVIVNPNGTDRVGSGVEALKNSAGETVAYRALNPNARYIQAGLGAYANGGRSTLPLRGINNFDISLIKRFSITESKKLELRAEGYNAFNHSQFTPGAINTSQPVARTDTRSYLTPGNALFGRADAVFENNARVIQMVARFTF